MLTLQERLTARVIELQSALANVQQLSGLLPICSYCKRIRSDKDYWEQVDSYVAHHSDVKFSHGICPSCFETVRADSERGLVRVTRASRTRVQNLTNGPGEGRWRERLLQEGNALRKNAMMDDGVVPPCPPPSHSGIDSRVIGCLGPRARAA